MNGTIRKLLYLVFSIAALAIASQYISNSKEIQDSIYEFSDRQLGVAAEKGNDGLGVSHGQAKFKFFHISWLSIAMFICWSLFAYVQIFSARFMKHLYIVWVFLHVLLGTLVLILSFISIIPYINFYTVKGVVGLFVTLLIIIMGISGTGDLIVKCDKKRCFLKPYIKWQWTHKITAWVNQVLVMIPQVIGMTWFELPGGLIAGLVLLNVALAASVVLTEVLYKKGFGAKNIQLRDPGRQNTVYTFQRLMKETNQDGKKLVVLDNKVIDVSGFAIFHPGGRALIEINYGTDVGRYFYGVYAQTPQYINYRHSAYALKMFQNKVVGVMKENYDIIQNMFGEDPIKQNQSDPFHTNVFDPNNFYSWKIHERKEITSLITRVTFSNGKKRKIILRDQKSWGKHFKYTAITEYGKNTRFYTFAFAIGNQSFIIHNELLKAYNENKPMDNNYSINLEVQGVDAFPKLYNYPKAFSRYLHQIPINSELNNLNVDGPLGVGLGLEDGDNGKYLAISAGTGLVPFIDLAFYLFRKNVRMASEKHGMRIAAFEDEEFDLLGEEFKFDLWGTFRSEDQVVAQDILEKTAEISKNQGFDNFNFNLRLSKRKDPRWDQDYITKNVDKSVKRIFVRGPQQFNQMIERYLVNAGYPQKDILHI